MRIGPIAHGALLVAALGFAYQTWTRDKSEAPKVGTVTVWNEPLADFEAFAYDGETKSVRVEKRGEGSDAYYWGQVTRTEKKKKKRVPVKGPADQDQAGGDDGHGPEDGHGHGGAAPGQPAPAPKPGAAPKSGTAPAPKSGTAPAPKSGAAPAAPKSGAAPAPKAPQSPHHTGTDQPDKPGAAPAAPAAPATPAAPAGDKPAAPAGDKPAAPAGDKPAAPAGDQSAEPAAAGGDAEGGEEEGGQDSAPEPAEPEEVETNTKEFPVGVSGKAVIVNLSHLHALRDLGTLSDKQKEEYGLTESKENLTVFFKGGKKHSLTLGSRVFGGGDRYVLAVETGKGYVISNSEIMRHIDGAESSLGLKGLHEFQDEGPGEDFRAHNPNVAKEKRDRYAGVAGLKIETPHGSRDMVRYEEPDPATGNTIVGWATKDKPKEQDVTFGNLVSQIDRIRPLTYHTDLDASSMTKIMTLKYLGPGGKQIAYFDLYRKEPSVTPEIEPSEEKKASEAEYYAETEITHSLGRISRMQAERISEDLPQLFGGAPPPEKGKGKGAPAKSGTDNPSEQPADKPVPSQPEK